MQRKRIAYALPLALALGSAAWAHPPAEISFQGQLMDHATGEPMKGTTMVTLRLFDDARAGTMLHEETDQVRFIRKTGSFVTQIGDGVRMDVARAFTGPLWVEVALGERVLRPRIHLQPSPFAVRALTSPADPLPMPEQTAVHAFGPQAAARTQALTPTASASFLERAVDQELCVARIEPWPGIQDGDRVRFVTRFPEGQHQWLRFVEQGYLEEEGRCPLVKDQGCLSVGGCNLRVASRRAGDAAVALRDPDEVVEFLYLGGRFFHMR